MDEIIGSSSGQGEINAVSTEIGDENVKDFSLESDTIHSRKRKRGQWAIGRRFQENWVSSFPFIEKYLLQMRTRFSDKLDVFCVVGKLKR